MERTIQELKNRNNHGRWASIIALGEFGEPVIEYLHHALEDDDKWVRCFAANALGNIGHRSSVDPLIRLLLDEDQDVRWGGLGTPGQFTHYARHTTVTTHL
jgi:HEAT repeat protein